MGHAPDVQVREKARQKLTSTAIGRIAALIALGVAIVVVFLLLAGGDGEEYQVTAEFENASQLVGGEQVVVGGLSVGSVSTIELGSNGQALITFTVNDDYAPLRRGTTATIRSYSLSGIANRQVQLTLPADERAGEEIPSGGLLSQSETVSEVDLDQLFNTLDPETVEDFKHVIQGFEISYDGVGEQANRGFHYLNPFLSTSRRLFSELTLDQRAFERLIVDTSQLSGALAERAPDIAALIGNLNVMMGAIGAQRQALAEAVSKLPAFMREANTTFVNLRATLDDTEPLVEASKPAARELRPFFAELRRATADAVPTIRDLDAIVRRRGADNDLVELTRLQVPLAERAIGSGAPECGAAADPDPAAGAGDDDFTQGAFGETVCSLTNGLPNLADFRPYTPELVGWFNDFSGSSGYIDAMGGLGRISTSFNQFTFSTPGVHNLGLPVDPADLISAGTVKVDRDQRCPGTNERPVPPADNDDDSVPFTDGGALDFCDPADLPPGP
jgi:phospholipid/cholesterol/gamma-HCH transport system substrate-binding protein